MEVEDELIQIANVTTPRIIKVIGVGGGGGNAVAQMYRDNIPEVRYLVANTDKKALDDNIVPDHLQLGPGLGAGGDPERGAALANECLDQINAALDDETKMVFVTAGMGGGTGTGASPVIAHAAREKGILTVGIVTIPFLFEREKQIDKALDGLDKLSKEVDAMLVINNQRLCDIYSDLSIINAFKRADETLSTAVSSITEIISMHGRVNLDFQDVNTTLRNGGVAVMSTGYAEGENRVTRAINDALNSPLLNNNDVFDASHILIAITTSSDDGATLRTGEVDEINAFMGHFNSDIETKWGLAF
ncbi:MAG: cell division FtsZ family protein, partial [Prevotellamassilia sp.]|nr:cell division FtsZ family protein [Prevotellamassilia sp.]